MNKSRRLIINQACDGIKTNLDILNQCKEEEDETKECIPENLQGGMKYYESEKYVDILDEEIKTINSSVENIKIRLI